ncbi:MAG: thiol:disulfide oxidoreductase, partial [Proteobacteria bacterium]|nr:thiol:disulfide oxidoreductase [Pseudomonadota bacterium]
TWLHRLAREGRHLAGFPNLSRWHAAVSQRPAVARAYARARAVNTVPTINKDSKALLFGRGAERRAA